MGRNLLVEGIADQIIITSAAQKLNDLAVPIDLDLDRISICFGGSCEAIVPLAQYCQGEGVDWVAMFDADTPGQTAAKKLNGKQSPASSVLVINQVEGLEAVVDIESVLPKQFYHDHVKKAYSQLEDHPATKSLPNSYQEVLNKVVLEKKIPEAKRATMARSKAYEIYFELKESWGDFDKVLVAKSIADALPLMAADEAGAVLELMAALLTDIGRRFPSNS